MKEYIVVSKFSIGIDDTTTLPFDVGDPSVYFDGKTKAIVGGEEMNLPKLRVAIREGWLQLKNQDIVPHRAQAAEMNIRGATPQQADRVHDGSTEMSEEERVVSSVDDRNEFASSQQALSNVKAAKSRSDTSVRENKVASSQDRQPRIQTVSDQNQGEDIGVKFKTSTKSSVDLSKVSGQQLNQMVHDLETKSVTPSTQKDLAPKRSSEGISFDNHNVGEKSALGTTETSPSGGGNPFADDAKVIGKVGEEQKEAAPEIQTSELEVEVEEEEVLDPKTKEGRYRIAKIIHPELPDWDFSAHWTHKMERLSSELKEDIIALRSIYASESKAIKRRMKEEFTYADL